ncbi:facilitated trehalose transporter Tret1-like isoform X1 [Polistes fuscatus]|uniref:facilitated trehalose transporter Tret1-like isoform X1 n=2 Tax=Polistes fuscatus TaxID=30207 RepID=UPI001CAA32DB|nr:facilitated trehalose transporter Tret1-like isoform X1 [Polistes fuscatus]
MTLTEKMENIVENAVSNGEKMKPMELNSHADANVAPISKYREALPQCCAVGAKNLVLITFGSTLGFSTILIPELQSKNSEIPATIEEITWISSLNLFLVPLGCLVSGPISQYFGRKRTMMLANIPFIMAWLIFHYSYNTTMLFIALALTGLTGGLIEAPVMTYVAEVTQPRLRGMLSATSSMSVILGVFSQMLGGSLANWRTVAMVNLAYPIICFTALLCVPESPHWLAAKGRTKEAESALCWLRGWVNPIHVKTEFTGLCDIIRKPVDAMSEKEKFWKSYKKKTCYAPFILVTIAFFIGAFGGTSILQTFAVVIFEEMSAPIDKYTAAVFLGIAELVGTVICVSTIHFTGKRMLTFFSLVGIGFCLLLAAIYGYLNDNLIIYGENSSWIPMTLLIAAAFLSHTGIRLLPWILAGEVFPVTVRSGATGAVGSIGYIFMSIANKTFLYMKTGITLSGTLLFYALVNCVGGIVLYYILPETEGRTLREIEEHYAGVQNLKNRPKKEELPFKEKWAATNPTVIYDDESKL